MERLTYLTLDGFAHTQDSKRVSTKEAILKGVLKRDPLVKAVHVSSSLNIESFNILREQNLSIQDVEHGLLAINSEALDSENAETRHMILIKNPSSWVESELFPGKMILIPQHLLYLEILQSGQRNPYLQSVHIFPIDGYIDGRPRHAEINIIPNLYGRGYSNPRAFHDDMIDPCGHKARKVCVGSTDKPAITLVEKINYFLDQPQWCMLGANLDLTPQGRSGDSRAARSGWSKIKTFFNYAYGRLLVAQLDPNDHADAMNAIFQRTITEMNPYMQVADFIVEKDLTPDIQKEMRQRVRDYIKAIKKGDAR